MASKKTATCFVYLAPARAEPRFKIGIAMDPHQRFAGLSDIDATKAWVAECDSTRQARGLERTLHFLFREHQLALPTRQDGHTEWFDTACWDDVFAFLREQQDRLGFGSLMELPRKPSAPVAGGLPKSARRRGYVPTTPEEVEEWKVEWLRQLPYKAIPKDAPHLFAFARDAATDLNRAAASRVVEALQSFAERGILRGKFLHSRHASSTTKTVLWALLETAEDAAAFAVFASGTRIEVPPLVLFTTTSRGLYHAISGGYFPCAAGHGFLEIGPEEHEQSKFPGAELFFDLLAKLPDEPDCARFYPESI